MFNKISIKKLIIGAGIILFVIFLTVYFIQRYQQSTVLLVVPDSPESISVDNSEQMENFTSSSLPYETPDIAIDYSHLLRKFYIYKKTTKANNAIRSFFSINKINAEDTDIVYVGNSNLYGRIIQDEYANDPSLPNPEYTDAEEDSSKTPLSTTEISRLNLLKKQLPYAGSSFAVAYSPVLRIYFYQVLVEKGEVEFNAFLQSYGLAQTLQNHSGLFTRISSNPTETVKKAERLDKIINDPATTTQDKTKYKLEFYQLINKRPASFSE